MPRLSLGLSLRFCGKLRSFCFKRAVDFLVLLLSGSQSSEQRAAQAVLAGHRAKHDDDTDDPQPGRNLPCVQLATITGVTGLGIDDPATVAGCMLTDPIRTKTHAIAWPAIPGAGIQNPLTAVMGSPGMAPTMAMDTPQMMAVLSPGGASSMPPVSATPKRQMHGGVRPGFSGA